VPALTGSHQRPPSLAAAGLDRETVRRYAARTVGGFLARLACAITHPAGQAEPGSSPVAGTRCICLPHAHLARARARRSSRHPPGMVKIGPSQRPPVLDSAARPGCLDGAGAIGCLPAQHRRRRSRHSTTSLILRIEPSRVRVGSCLIMGAFDLPVTHLQPHEPFLPAWRMSCQCSFRPGRRGEITACGCRSWWRVGKRGRWYAISQRRAFRTLLPDLMRELGHFEMTGNWPGD
jgi:hypothetical protein